MFDDQTVLILGAGASRPYGLPTSGELRKIILGGAVEALADLGFPSPESADGLLEFESTKQFGEEHLERFRTHFSNAQRVSIDSFIAGRDGGAYAGTEKRIAQFLVSRIILMCEREEALNGDWYQWFLEFLLRKGRDFPAGLVSVITFNYDRTLEHYLHRAFLHAYPISEEEANEMVKRIEIIHVYGSVGSLRKIGFGIVEAADEGSKMLALASARIQEDTSARVRTMIEEADRMIFLGFGFWTENLDVLLGTSDPRSAERWHKKQVFASCYKLWRSTQIEVDARLRNRAGSDRPLINWGNRDENVFKFVTNYNLKATG